MANFKALRETAVRGAVFGSFAALFMTGIAFALTYNWSDPSALRGKASGNQLQSSQWNLLVGNVDNLNERLAGVETNVAVPTGTVIAFNGTSCPAGWTEAAGTAVPAGAGGSSTLDLRGEFIRGWDHGKGVDPSRTALSKQNATRIRNLIDNYYGYAAGTFAVAAWNIESNGGGSDTVPEGSTTSNPTMSNTTYYQASAVASPGSSDNWAFATRPRNVALLYCVKN